MKDADGRVKANSIQNKRNMSRFLARLKSLSSFSEEKALAKSTFILLKEFRLSLKQNLELAAENKVKKTCLQMAYVLSKSPKRVVN